MRTSVLLVFLSEFKQKFEYLIFQHWFSVSGNKLDGVIKFKNLNCLWNFEITCIHTWIKLSLNVRKTLLQHFTGINIKQPLIPHESYGGGGSGELHWKWELIINMAKLNYKIFTLKFTPNSFQDSFGNKMHHHLVGPSILGLVPFIYINFSAATYWKYLLLRA